MPAPPPVTCGHLPTHLAALSLRHRVLYGDLQILLASVEPLPFSPEHCSSVGLWEEVLFLSHPVTGAPAESHPSLRTKILLDIGVAAISEGGSEQSERADHQFVVMPSHFLSSRPGLLPT